MTPIEWIKDKLEVRKIQKGVKKTVHQTMKKGYWVAKYDPATRSVYREFPNGERVYIK